jgi:hypothetical protein
MRTPKKQTVRPITLILHFVVSAYRKQKTTLDAGMKLNELLTKYGIKLVGAWVSPSEHLTVAVYDAPNMEEHCGSYRWNQK